MNVAQGSDEYYAWWVVFSEIDKLYEDYANLEYQFVMGVVGSLLIVVNIGLLTNQIRTLNNAEVTNYSYSYSTLKPQEYMDELGRSGVKYTAEDVIMVTKTPTGELRWLEVGNSEAGLTHIIHEHTTNLADKGIDVMDIPVILRDTLQTTPFNTGRNAVGPYADYLINGIPFRVPYGDNGYIVNFYPQ